LFGPITSLWNSYVDLISWSLHRLTDMTASGGLAIIIFTVLLKTVLLPLTVKSIRSTAAMQELQPKIKELQKKYAKDRNQLTQETMRLYQEYRINPMAGCLPMLIQIPIFFGLYFAVRDLSRTAGDFLWLPSLAEADPWKILPILAGVFQFVQTRMMRPHKAPKITDPQQAMMNTMMNFMPIMVIVFGWTFASGAVLYWATQSVYSVI
jgi:YidC/Oxa1 family membrane protein insertase